MSIKAKSEIMLFDLMTVFTHIRLNWRKNTESVIENTFRKIHWRNQLFENHREPYFYKMFQFDFDFVDK